MKAEALYASHVRQNGLPYLKNSSNNTLNAGILNSCCIFK